MANKKRKTKDRKNKDKRKRSRAKKASSRKPVTQSGSSERLLRSPSKCRFRESAESLLTLTWSQLQEATRSDGIQLFHREIWSGTPAAVPGVDPFLLSGLEFVCICYPNREHHNSWQEEMQASIISFGEYFDCIASPARGEVHRYLGSIVQLIDPESDYGQLRSQQRIRGSDQDAEQFDSAIVREVLLAVQVGTPTTEEAKQYRRMEARTPSVMLLAPVTPMKIPPADDQREPAEIFAEDIITEALNDMEVDRLWSLSVATAIWLIDPRESAQLRVKEREHIQVSLNHSEQEVRLLESKVAELTETHRQFSERLDKVALSLEQAQREEREFSLSFGRESSQARSSLQRLENEERRLAGVRKEVLRKIRDGSEEDRALLERRILNAEEALAKIPQQRETQSRTLRTLEQEFQSRHPALEQEAARAASAHSEATEAFVKIDRALSALLAELRTQEQISAQLATRLAYY